VKEAKEGEVQLDDNFHAYLQLSPLFLSEGSKRLLNASVFNDTIFLTAINVMDYSLLVGVDEAAQRLVVGIIDYMRPYTMDKQAEFYYKSALDRVALKASHEAPTVIPPPEYKQRFRNAMARDFLAAPSKLSVLRQARDPAS
jgi:1-phosphatidylinositol-3-phosphate 5-kinase